MLKRMLVVGMMLAFSWTSFAQETPETEDFQRAPAAAKQEESEARKADAEYGLDEIVVGATKTSTALKNVTTNVSVVSSEDFKKVYARDVSDYLRQVPGFHFSDFGSIRADVYASSRGNQPFTRGVQFLYDGIEYNMPSGYMQLLSIPSRNLDRIEVIKNPASPLYGNFGVGGVVSIVPRTPTDPYEVTVSGSYGSYDTQYHTASFGGAQCGWEYYTEGRFYKTKGYQDNTWEEHGLLHTRLKYHFDDGMSVGMHFNYAPLHNGYPGTLDYDLWKKNPKQTVQPWGEGDSYSLLGALTFDKAFGASALSAKVKYGFMEGFALDPDYFVLHSYNVVPEINYQIQHTFWGIPGTFLVGTEARYYNNDGSPVFAAPNGIKGQLTTDRVVKDTTLGFYVQEQISPLKDLTFSFGTRFDHVETDFQDRLTPSRDFEETHNAWSPKAGVTYTVSNALNVFGNFSRGFRNPTTAGSGYVFNPDLKPEFFNSYEVGLRGQPLSWLSYNVAGFLVEAEDKIVRIGGPRRFENVGETRTTGCELGVNLGYQTGLHGSLNYTYALTEFTDYTTLAGVSFDGKEIPLVPNHLFGVSAGYTSPLLGRLDLMANYVSQRYVDLANLKHLPGYATLDAKYLYSFGKHAEFFLSGKNLTDKQFVDVAFDFGAPDSFDVYTMPGVTVAGGINLYF